MSRVTPENEKQKEDSRQFAKTLESLPSLSYWQLIRLSNALEDEFESRPPVGPREPG